MGKIRKRYYSKKRKENSNYGFLSVFLRVNCEKYTKNVFRNYEIYKNMKKHIDKLFLQDNNVITLIKHFIKDKTKQYGKGGNNYVTAGNDKSRRNYF